MKRNREYDDDAAGVRSVAKIQRYKQTKRERFDGRRLEKKLDISLIEEEEDDEDIS